VDRKWPGVCSFATNDSSVSTTTMSDLETSRYLPARGRKNPTRERFLMRCFSAEELRRREQWTHRVSRGSAFTAFVAVIALVALQSSARPGPPSRLEYIAFYLLLLGCAGLIARLLLPSLRPGWYRSVDYRYCERLHSLCSANQELRRYCSQVHAQNRAITRGEFVTMRRWAARHSPSDEIR
jgi:hypothetical protein